MDADENGRDARVPARLRTNVRIRIPSYDPICNVESIRALFRRRYARAAAEKRRDAILSAPIPTEANQAPKTRGDASTTLALPSTKRVENEANRSNLFGGARPDSLVRPATKRRRSFTVKKHDPWRLYRVVAGHVGWVTALECDPANRFMVSGSVDRTIKLWDIARGALLLTLTGHIDTVTGIRISRRRPYMVTSSLDKNVKLWDLEANKSVLNFHGHLSGVRCVALHPDIDIMMSGGRDSAVRVWDMRTGTETVCLSGHSDAVTAVLGRAGAPHVVSGSQDSTVRLWDLRITRKCITTLTHHKKGVRALVQPEREQTFASFSAGDAKKFLLPEGIFLHDMGSEQPGIIHSAAMNEDGVLVTGGDDGQLWFRDWESGTKFQDLQVPLQPGSLSAEGAVYAATFDASGSRLITGGADKTLKFFKEA